MSAKETLFTSRQNSGMIWQRLCHICKPQQHCRQLGVKYTVLSYPLKFHTYAVNQRTVKMSESQGSVKEEWVETKSGKIAGVCSVGLGPGAGFQALEDHQVIIVIPGNPGLACFYSEFMIHLHSKLGDSNTSIWAIDHVGHHGPQQSLLPLGNRLYVFKKK